MGSTQAEGSHRGVARTMGAGGEKFRKRVMNPRVFRAYMLFKMPVLGVTCTTLERLDRVHCEALVPYGWGAKNLFGSMDAAVLLGAAKIASACLWMVNIRSEGVDVLPVLRGVTMDIERKVREPVRARCVSGEVYGDAVDAAKAGEEDALVETSIDLVTERHGDRVATVTLTWSLEPK